MSDKRSFVKLLLLWRKMSKIAHHPVLVAEIIKLLETSKLGIFVDCTVGAGGHAEAILSAHPEIKMYVAIDQDPTALTLAKERLRKWEGRVMFQKGNFASLETILNQVGISEVDGILIDLGVSSMQLDQAERGFSFQKDGPLDMRMDPTNPLSAALVVNTFSQRELEIIFRDLGEEKYWRPAARAIIQARQLEEIATTAQLVKILQPVIKVKPGKGIHPCTLIFQALRIYVNRELEVIEQVIPQAIRKLAKGGRLGVISFHSLEDRIVKNLFRHAASDKWETQGLAGLFRDKIPEIKLLNRKPICGSPEEIQFNPRSRSAKLRFIEKL